MSHTNNIQDLLGEWYSQFEAIPAGLHILCPKVSDDDLEDYRSLNAPNAVISWKEKKARIAQSQERIKITYWTSLIFGYDPKKAGEWLQAFDARVNGVLNECDMCIINWHMNRSKYLAEFSGRWSEEAVEKMATLLTQFDFRRIDRSLDWVQEVTDSVHARGAEFKKSALGDRYTEVLLAVFEALCCMPYLSIPDKRRKFQAVFAALQSRKPLRLGAKVPLPAMTTFLFDDQPCRRPFARLAWEQIDADGLTHEQWDWAVGEHLAAAIADLAARPDAGGTAGWDETVTFWDGFKLILRTLSEDLVLHRLRAMEVKPSIYDLLFMHLPTQSEAVLVKVVDVFSCLLQKSPKAFWGAIGETRSAIIAEQVFAAPMYPSLLNQSLHLGEVAGTDEPVTIAWIGAFMRSLDVGRMQDACDAMLRLLLDSVSADRRVTREGRAACMRAALDCLDIALQLFLNLAEFNTSTVLVYVNGTLMVAAKHIPHIVACLRGDGSELSEKLGLREAALAVMTSMLKLDVRAAVQEYKTLLLQDAKKVQQAVFRQPSRIWRAFTDAMMMMTTTTTTTKGGLAAAGGLRLDIVKPVLMAMMPLIVVDELRPLRRGVNGQPPKLAPAQARFNAEFATTAEALGRVFDLLADAGHDDLMRLCEDKHLLRPVFLFPLHGNATISQAATSLFKSVTDETARTGAITGLLRLHFGTSLDSFTHALNAVMRPPFVWGPMQQLVAFSRDMVTSLCDPSDGLLRLQGLRPDEVSSVFRWWGAQWRAINDTFKHTDEWSMTVELGIMTPFCRDVIELADYLLSQVGVVASAMNVPGVNLGLAPVPALMGPIRTYLLSLCEMLRLRDEYLVDMTVTIVGKVAERILEEGMTLEEPTTAYVAKVCVPGPDGRFQVATKLSSTQKAELIKMFRIDVAKEADDLQLVAVRPAKAAGLSAGANKQSRLDAWTKSGSNKSASGASTPSEPSDAAATVGRTAKEVVRELGGATTVDKKRSLLDAMRAQAALTAAKPKPKPKGPDASALAQQMAFREARMRQKAEAERRKAELVAKIKGDAQAKKSDMMVETSDEEDGGDDDDGDGEGKGKGKGRDDEEYEQDDAFMREFLEGSAAASKSLEAMNQRHRQNALALKTTGPVRKQKQVRSAKDMRARLSPSMAKLHQTILEWDIFHDGADPPNGAACVRVADRYLDHAGYRNTFYPLLVYEAWRSFATDRDEATGKPFGIRVATRMNVDSFLEVTALMPAAKYREAGLSEGDVLVLSPSEDPLRDRAAPHCLARVWRSVFKKDQTETTYRLSHSNSSNKSNNTTPQALIKPGFSMYAARITNMATIEREYAALESLQYCELRAEVMEARPSPMLTFGEQRIDACVRNYDLNRGQAKAVLCATDNDAFTLIQGPPGTGKTKTIVAMVGALLTGVVGKKQQPAGVSVGVTRSLVNNGHQQQQPQSTKKLLVCAPSNAAVDELVLRLKQGVKTTDGALHRINVLRLGRSDAVNAANKDVTLDEIVRKRMEGDKTQETARAERDKLHAEAGRVSREVQDVRRQLDAARNNNDNDKDKKSNGNGNGNGNTQMVVDALVRQLDSLKRRQAELGRRIDADKDSGNTAAREVELRRRQIQDQVLGAADVLCATLSGSGHDMFKNLAVEFETVIIDEAAQCVELSALIPLKYGALKCVLVGDPKQLPPTVLSQSAARFGYDQSLFVRMQRNCPDAVHLLNRQYRMHPAISLFPSRQFYEGKLLDGGDSGDSGDGGDMATVRRQRWHANPILAPYRFFDVHGAQQRGGKGQSLVNLDEIKVAMQLYDRFVREVGGYSDGGGTTPTTPSSSTPSTSSSNDNDKKTPARPKIGIITPYKAQLHELRNRFAARYGPSIAAEVEFNTTDAFQGRECDVIIFSCVRASPTGGIGFMTDIRRMNVGLTRARSSLWILGDSRALAQGEFWNRLILDAQERGVYTTGDVVGLIRASRAEEENEDVVMDDAPQQQPPRQQPQQPQQPQQQPQQQQTKQPPPPQPKHNNPRFSSPSGPPARSSSPARPPSGSKRPRDGPDDGPCSKKPKTKPQPLPLSLYMTLPSPLPTPTPALVPQEYVDSSSEPESTVEVETVDSDSWSLFDDDDDDDDLSDCNLPPLFTPKSPSPPRPSAAIQTTPPATQTQGTPPAHGPRRNHSPRLGSSRTASPASSDDPDGPTDANAWDEREWIRVLAGPSPGSCESESKSSSDSEEKRFHVYRKKGQAVMQLLMTVPGEEYYRCEGYEDEDYEVDDVDEDDEDSEDLGV